MKKHISILALLCGLLPMIATETPCKPSPPTFLFDVLGVNNQWLCGGDGEAETLLDALQVIRERCFEVEFDLVNEDDLDRAYLRSFSDIAPSALILINDLFLWDKPGWFEMYEGDSVLIYSGLYDSTFYPPELQINRSGLM